MSVSILILTSCSTTYTQSASNQKEEVKTSQKATITLQENGQNFSEKKCSSKGDDLLSILKRNFEVKEDNGFITSLEGHSQDEKINSIGCLLWTGKVLLLVPKRSN